MCQKYLTFLALFDSFGGYVLKIHHNRPFSPLKRPLRSIFTIQCFFPNRQLNKMTPSGESESEKVKAVPGRLPKIVPDPGFSKSEPGGRVGLRLPIIRPPKICESEQNAKMDKKGANRSSTRGGNPSDSACL